MNLRPSERGVSLVEAVLAVGLLAGGLVTVTQLAFVAAAAVRGSRAHTTASMLADEQIERLRSLAWSLTSDGTRVSDPALSPSPPGALEDDAPGYSERLDANGVALGPGAAAQAAFVRRWSITPLPESPDDTLVIQVRVAPLQGRGGGALPGAGEAWIATVRTRRVP